MNNQHVCPACAMPLSIETCAVYFPRMYDFVFNDSSDRLLKPGRDADQANTERALDPNIQGSFANMNPLPEGWFYKPEGNDFAFKNLDFTESKEYDGWYKLTVNRDNENKILSALLHHRNGRTHGGGHVECFPACNDCGYPLPVDFFDCKQIVLAMCGKTSSGKSIAQICLANNGFYCLSKVDGGFAPVSGGCNWGDEGWYNHVLAKLDDNLLPGQTVAGRYMPLLFELKRGGTKYLISLFDISGEYFSRENHPKLRPILNKCHGCVMTISSDDILQAAALQPKGPAAPDQGRGVLSYEEQINVQTRAYRSQSSAASTGNADGRKKGGGEMNPRTDMQRINAYMLPNSYIAVCLTKADKCVDLDLFLNTPSVVEGDWQDNVFSNKSLAIEKFVTEAGYPFAFNPPERGKYFAFSALGHGDTTLIMDGDVVIEEVLDRRPDPKCLEEPFLWLINSIIDSAEGIGAQ